MVFNSFLVRLDIKENNFSGIIQLEDKNFAGNFKKIGGDIFVFNSKNKLNISFMDQVLVKSRNKKFSTLLPIISEYTKRKLTRIAKIITKYSNLKIDDLIIDYLILEKVYSVGLLIDFFKVDQNYILQLLLRKEIKKEIKLINIKNLTISSYDYFLEASNELNELLKFSYSSRKKSINSSDVEKKIKIPYESLFFKYLVRREFGNFELRILKEKIIFDNLPLTREEKNNVNEIIGIIKKNRLNVFSIPSIMKISLTSSDKVNDALWNMLGEDLLIQLDSRGEHFMFSEEFNRIINRLKKFKRNQGDLIDIASVREITSFNRKNIIILLEYLDSKKITSRNGNKRKLELPV